MWSLLCLLFLITPLCTSQTSQEAEKPLQFTGQINGIVVNEAGSPIPGAQVTVEAVGKVVLGRAPKVLTDESGKFFLVGVPVGEVIISASKPSDFYADSSAAVFYDGESLTKIRVAAGESHNEVKITIKKGAKLYGSILDAETAKPILSARIRVIRVNAPEAMFATSPSMQGTFEFAIVADQEYKLRITAPGYSPWPSSDNVINLRSGISRRLDVELKKEK